ncbi:Uncharacterized protein C4orf19, partial [Mesitornis unicolor]
MGCRCCKMLKSYIFDPEEVQSPGGIHEVNSYKHNEQGNKFKFKDNTEIQEHKNEPQKDELNKTETLQANSTKETLWNHGGNDFQEDGIVKCVAKLDVAVNGGTSCTRVHSVLNPNTNSVEEASEQGTSSPSAESSSASNRDLYTRSKRSSHELDLEAGRQRKAACIKPNSIQYGNCHSAGDGVFLNGSAVLETQNYAIQLPDIDYPQNGSQTRNYIEKYSFSVNCVHSDQNSGPSPIQDQDLCVTPPLPMKESGTEPFKTDSATGDTTAVTVTKAVQAPTHPNHKDINGETEEEDAEVAAALAALEAATAGEDLEDDD